MDASSKLPTYLTRGLQASLLLLAFAVPLSIAATQTAWSLALLFWILRAVLVRPRVKAAGMDLAVIAFLGLTIVSSFFSYEQEVSLRKLVSVSLVTIVYLVSSNVSGTKMLQRLIAVLLIGAGVSAVYALGNFAIGRNLKVNVLTADSPLRVAGVMENDTIQKVNGKGVSSPDDVIAAAAASDAGIAKVEVYRFQVILNYDLPSAGFAGSGDSGVKLGIASWSRGRDIRASGFYGHYTTYAEGIQLILSVVFGLLIMLPGGSFSRNRVLFAAMVAAFCFALFLTVTRASWAGFAISAAVMILIGTSKRTILICAALAVPLALGGIFYLQQKRNVAFIDTSDNSTTWRMTVWREGFGVLTSSPRHLLVGVGMDSLKTHWRDWHMFDNGNLPLGHLHSTPLELAFERGVPVLIAWIIWMFLYLRMLWRGFRRDGLGWQERGLLLGALGGTVGFLSSGLVHYNWGDSEVAMIFYLLMGLSLAAIRLGHDHPADYHGSEVPAGG